MGMTEAGFRSVVSFAVLGLTLGFVVMVRVLRGDRRAGFFATGMVLSLVPVCSTLPNDRLLLFSGLRGVRARGTRFLLALARRGRARSAGAGARGALRVRAPGRRADRVARAVARYHPFLYGGATSAAATPRCRKVGPGGTLCVIMNAPDLDDRQLRGERRRPAGPATAEPCACSRRRWTTTAAPWRASTSALEMTLREGFVGDPTAQLPRGQQLVPFFAGDVTEVSGMTAEVLEVTAEPEAVEGSIHVRQGARGSVDALDPLGGKGVRAGGAARRSGRWRR